MKFDHLYSNRFFLNMRIFFRIKKKRNLISKRLLSRLLIRTKNCTKLLSEHLKNQTIKNQLIGIYRQRLMNSQSLESLMRHKMNLNYIRNITFGKLDKIVELINLVLSDWFDIEILFFFLLFDSLEIFFQSLFFEF